MRDDDLRRKGIYPVAPIRSAFLMFPRGNGSSSGRWMYAVGFADGLTKIGVASRPLERMGSYWREARGQILWAHVCGKIVGDAWYAVERMALSLAEQEARRVGRTEYFSGLPRARAIACCRQAAQGKRPIPATTLPLVRHEIKRAERMEAEAEPVKVEAVA